MSANDSILRKLNIAPGINKNTTQLNAEGYYVSCDKVRFYYNEPEKLGGWVRETVNGSVNGVARDIISFVDFDEQTYLSFGTHTRLYLLTGNDLHDITPITASACASNAFSVSLNSTLVTLSVNPEGRQIGDYFIFTQTTASVGGIDLPLNTPFIITDVGTGHITFETGVSATTSVSGVGGTVNIDYYYESGLQSNGLAYGWGAGTWGTPGVSVCAGWSEPRGGTGVGTNLRQWSLDNWGQDLIANPQGGPIFTWEASAGPTQRAYRISAAPSIVNIALVGQEGRHLIALGTHNISGDFDPNLVRWSDSENYSSWVPASNNQAGDFRLENGSKILGATETKREILIFTDENVYSMQRIGGAFVFSFADLGKHNGLQSIHAAVDVNGTVYWMGYSSFHEYNGVIQTLPCSMQKEIFDPRNPNSVNLEQNEKIFCGTNREFNEVWWLYPSRDSEEIDRYIIFNFLEKLWYGGTIVRTVWQDRDIFEKPYAFDADGTLYIHEQGENNDAANLKAFLKTSFFDISDGDDLMFVDRVVPDHEITQELNYQFTYKKYPNDTETFTKGPYKVTPTVKKFNPRVRGRQAQITYSTSVQGSDFRLGADRFSVKPDGKR